MKGNNIKVFILTFCRNIDLVYGSELIFKTLRIGFPTAEINVIDNASVLKARDKIKSLAKENNCNFTSLKESVLHAQFLNHFINESEGTLVFLDPDIILWENIEEWKMECLIAGRFIPEYYDPLSKCINLPRLHTSFLYIPDAAKLKNELTKIEDEKFEADFFKPYMFFYEDNWYRLDTAANLYSALGDKTFSFTEKELNAYDHIFCGCHVDLIENLLGDYSVRMKEVHQLAQTDYMQLKGIYKEQDLFFQQYGIV
jgi:hypothetical protein